MQRLLVTKLTSIGVVEDGDNPGAMVMLYKAKPEPERKRRDPRALFVKALADQDAQLAEVTTTAAEARQTIDGLRDERDTMPETETMTTADVRRVVDEKASRLMSKDDTLTLAEARAEVWRKNPVLILKAAPRPAAPTRHR